MKRGTLIKSFALMVLCVFLFTKTLEKQNSVTAARLEIPALRSELRAINEENTRLQYTVDAFENPETLLELLRQQEYSHLKHPFISQVVCLKEGALEIDGPQPVDKAGSQSWFKPPLVIGAHQ